jgi:hypothetical protein
MLTVSVDLLCHIDSQDQCACHGRCLIKSLSGVLFGTSWFALSCDVSDSVLSQTVVRLQVADLSARLAKGKLVNIPIAARFT